MYTRCVTNLRGHSLARDGCRSTSLPERYGETIVSTALQILGGKPTPPAICTQHFLVLTPETLASLDLSRLPYEWITSADYGAEAHSQSAINRPEQPGLYSA